MLKLSSMTSDIFSPKLAPNNTSKASYRPDHIVSGNYSLSNLQSLSVLKVFTLILDRYVKPVFFRSL